MPRHGMGRPLRHDAEPRRAAGGSVRCRQRGPRQTDCRRREELGPSSPAVSRLPPGFGEQGHRCRHHRHARPLALPHHDRCLRGREGCLCGKACCQQHCRVRRYGGCPATLQPCGTGGTAETQRRALETAPRIHPERAAGPYRTRQHLGQLHLRSAAESGS